VTPIIRREEQVTPLASHEEIERAVAMPGDLAVLVAICAGAGLRVSEALALHVGDDGVRDAWEPDQSAIFIRQTLKTEAAARKVYVAPDLNSFIIERLRHCSRGDGMFSISRSGLYRALEDAGLPPCHSYRRFFATWRDEAGMNAEVLKSLMGHSKGGDVTDGYKFTAKKTEFVIAEVARVGLGFALPVRCLRETHLQDAEAPSKDPTRLLRSGFRGANGHIPGRHRSRAAPGLRRKAEFRRLDGLAHREKPRTAKARWRPR